MPPEIGLITPGYANLLFTYYRKCSVFVFVTMVDGNLYGIVGDIRGILALCVILGLNVFVSIVEICSMATQFLVF